jgi:hypothetical protein
VDARDLIKTDNNHQNAAVNFVVTNNNIKTFFNRAVGSSFDKKRNLLAFVTGYIASSLSTGETTTVSNLQIF